MKRGNYENRHIKLGEGIYYGGGHIHVTDEKGSYSIPVGRKARRTLCVLKEIPGQYRRCIEIDLITGRIYLSVDHDDDETANVYYYDMASEKLWNARLLRLLNIAAREGMVLDKDLRKVIVKLPCSDWKEMLEALPGWHEIFEHKLDNLLLTEDGAERIPWSMSSSSMTAPDHAEGTQKDPVREKLGGNFSLQNTDGVWELHYADQTAGGEFFGNVAEYIRRLSPLELDWVLHVLTQEDAEEQLVRFLRREIAVVPAENPS